MRLINTETVEFEEFFDSSEIPLYAILSHTWDRELGEQLYQAVVKIQEKYAHQSSAPPVPGPPLSESVLASPGPHSSAVPLPGPLSSESASPPSGSPSDAETAAPLIGVSEDHQDTVRPSWIRRIRIPFIAKFSSWRTKFKTQKQQRRSVHDQPSPLSSCPEPHSPSQPPLDGLAGEVTSDLLPSAPNPGPEAPTARPSPARPSIWDSDSGLSEKIRKACEIARHDGYGYIWVDSSCIDKTSSSELSEAINSMFNWYRGAEVCYVFLSDVPSLPSPSSSSATASNNNDNNMEAEDSDIDPALRAEGSKFRKSRWFTRVWTLQELIAPRLVVFLSKEWEPLGTKDTLKDLIRDMTRIDCGILTHEKALDDESVAERMRWASTREATRVEDEAYSLLGIFGITMSTLYGEGRYAFRRLQEAILQRIPDQSLFAWGETCCPVGPQKPSCLWYNSCHWSPFAYSPRLFNLSDHSSHIIRASDQPKIKSLELPVEEYNPTPYGLRTKFRLLPLLAFNPALQFLYSGNAAEFPGHGFTWYLALLGSQDTADKERLLCRLCHVTCPKSGVELIHVVRNIWDKPALGGILTVSLADLERAKSSMQTKTVYLPHLAPEPFTARKYVKFGGMYEPHLEDDTIVLNLALPTWARVAPRPYRLSDPRPTEHHHPNSHSLILSHPSFNIHIQYRHMARMSHHWHSVIIEARVWISDEDVQSDTIQCAPPYTSAVWAHEAPWPLTLPVRRRRLVMHSGHEVTLLLGLGLTRTAPFHYNVRIDVARTPVTAPEAPDQWGSQRTVWPEPDWHDPEDFKFTVLGSVRKALESQGYSVHVEPEGLCRRSHSQTHPSVLIIISNPAADSGFTILIRYFHMFQRTEDGQLLLVVARVILESSSVPSNASETYQDGPYVVGWGDMSSWNWSHKDEYSDRQQVLSLRLTTPTGDSLTLRLGLHLAWKSEYYLHVDIKHNRSSSPRGEPDPRHGRITKPFPMGEPHSSVTLTLPGHVKRALQSQGYDIRFKGFDEDHPDCCHLTLADANLTIDIEYSHHPSTDSEQGLTFRACVKALSSRRSQDAADPVTQPDGRAVPVNWDAWRLDKQESWGIRPGGWHWQLTRKDVNLALLTGLQLTLRLGFYLIWLSEYCLTVEVVPLSPLSRTTSRETLGTPHTGTNGEDAGDDPDMLGMTTGEADN